VAILFIPYLTMDKWIAQFLTLFFLLSPARMESPFPLHLAFFLSIRYNAITQL